MRKSRAFPILLILLTLLAVNALAGDASPPQPGLRDPKKKEIAMELVSAAENSSLDWKAQYGYIEYNVEHNDAENRGYTGGIIGFTSRTHDMLELVRAYQKLKPDNPLVPFIGPLKRVDGTPAKTSLGMKFVAAWKAAAATPEFRAAQDAEGDRVYFDPAVNQAQQDGLHELGQFCYYDAIVMHGAGDDADSFGGIRAAAMKQAKTPAQGGDESTYLNAFLDARVKAMKDEQGHQDVSRVETEQRLFLKAGNLHLDPPLKFQTYGDAYEIK